MARIRAYFFAGILITAPISITFYIAWILVNFVDGQVARLLPADYNPNTYLPFSIPGLGLIVAISMLTLIGWITAGFLGRLFLRVSEAILRRMPVVSSIYSWVKQIFETVFHERASPFREVVLVEFPRKGLWRIGFVTGRTPGSMQDISPAGLLNVFLPGTPNAASGFLVLVPTEDIYRVDLTPEEALKLIVSAGIATPPERIGVAPQPDRNSLTAASRSNK
ncbi:MAG: DUF502 domain-containing protein [Alphaproteobacteria bacterium]|nr:DUF502 domain-containing protein [Alphaproteobacteria bacterium]